MPLILPIFCTTISSSPRSGFSGEIAFDAAKTDGTPRKLMRSAKLKFLGWEPRISLRDGVADTYRHFLSAGDSRQ